MPRQADVVIPVYGGVEVTRQCIESVLEHSGPALAQLLVIDDCSPEPGMAEMLAGLAREHPGLTLLRNEENLGFVRTANRGLALRRRDVVLLNSDTRVTPGWLAELLEVADSDERVAAVVPLSNNATMCSVPEYGRETKASELEGVALRLDGLPRATRMPTGVGFCLLLRHRVLNMIGGLDPAYGRGYNEENDWCARAGRLGFTVLRANRALVFHLGSVSFGDARSELDRRNAHLLSHRFPDYVRQNQLFEAGPEARVAAAGVKPQVSGRVAVCVDAGPLLARGEDGQELLRALSLEPGVELAVRVDSPEQAARIGALEVPVHVGAAPLDRFQVLHRPAPLDSREELSRLLAVPCHVVLTQPDALVWQVPPASGPYDEAPRRQAIAHAALQAAQAVITGSEDARRALIAEVGLAPERIHVIPPGLDPDAFDPGDAAADAAARQALGVEGPFFVYAGGDEPRHNLRLLLAAHALYRARAEARREGPTAELVLVGPASGAPGSLYDRTPVWPPGVTYLGDLPRTRIRALLRGALAAVYPAAAEGFPASVAEALASGTPQIVSSLSGIPEVAGDAALTIEDFTPEELAGHLEALAGSPELRERLRQAARARAPRFTHGEAARRLAEVYREVALRPPAESLRARRMLAHLLGALT